MKKIQVQGAHHITLVGSTRQVAIDFWEGVLGMPFIFEQPNLGKPDENHLYFDPGDGRLLTVFTNESLQPARRHAPREVGCVEHIAFNVSRATFTHAPARLRERGIEFIAGALVLAFQHAFFCDGWQVAVFQGDGIEALHQVRQAAGAAVVDADFIQHGWFLPS